MKMMNKTAANIGTAITVPVSLCTGKVLMDVTSKLLPKHVGIPMKIAYKVGTVGLTIIADSLVRNAVEDMLVGAGAWSSEEVTIEPVNEQQV